VRIILNESSDTGQTAESAARLVTVKDTKLGETKGQLSVTPLPAVKDQAVSRAVHGLDGELLFVYLETEHVLAVMLPVAGRLPQLGVVDVR
jgi:hypothetical protein